MKTKEQNCDYMYNCRTRCRPQRVNTPKTAWCQRWSSAQRHLSFIHFVIDQKCHCTISGGPCRSIPSKLLCQTGRHKWSVQSHLNPDPSNCIIIFFKADTGETLVTRTCVLEDMNSQCGLFKFQVTRDWKYNDHSCS